MLVFLLLAYSCTPQPREMTPLSPQAEDGVMIFKMNHIGHEDHFAGRWTAPKLGRDKKFFRSPLAPNSEVRFQILKKEAFIVEVGLYEESPFLKIKINTKVFPVSGHRFRRLIAADDVEVGENRISFLFSGKDKISVQQIRVYPKRFQKLEKKVSRGMDFLTSVRFHYILNLLKKSKLILSYAFGGQRVINGKITVTSENSENEYVQSIENRKRFQITTLDESLHHITIEIPEINSPFIRIQESKLDGPKKRTTGKASIRKMAQGKSVLVILLDAARADHMSYSATGGKQLLI